MIKKFRLLTSENCKEIREKIKEIESEDGKKTAGSFAQQIKNNRQITVENEKARPLLQAIYNQLYNHAGFKVYAFPKNINRAMINIHGPGEFYGRHVDNTWMQSTKSSNRADISFTVFLEEPDKYTGGELCIHHPDLTNLELKAEAGEIIIYDSGFEHQVKPVTEGTRIGFVGWVESWIPDARIRSVITSMDIEIARLKNIDGIPREDMSELHRIYNELLRAHMR